MKLNPEQQRLAQINAKASGIAAGIKILEPLSWPLEQEERFLKAWKRKQTPRLEIHYPPAENAERVRKLTQILASFTAESPLEIFTQKTLESYILAAEMVDAAGTPLCQQRSIELYGKPGDTMPGSNKTLVDVAKDFLDNLHQLEYPFMREPESCVSAQMLKAELLGYLGQRLGRDTPEIQISPDLAAKATAGATRVRLRDETCFNIYDGKQLFVHEIMTHALTAINGKKQPILSLMGLSAPRTTRTQEGLAAFSEVITGAIDIKRLSRLALRIVAIDRALSGADFVETFRFFLDHGQSDKESFWSAARIFRGGYPDKNIVFTKDSVYLEGLIEIYTLFLWAIKHQRLDLTHLLFAGRLTIDDLFLLEPAFENGAIETPAYLPEWYAKIEGLAGMLSFTSMLQHVDIDRLEADYFSAQDLQP